MALKPTKLPGVYSELDASRAISLLPGSAHVIAIVSKFDSKIATPEEIAKIAGKKYVVTSYKDAKDTFKEDSTLSELCRVAFLNGAQKIIAMPIGDTTYKSAFEELSSEEAVRIVICDSNVSTDLKELKTHVESASENRNERIAVIGAEENDDATAVAREAADFRSNRIVFVDPAPLDDEDVALPGCYMAAAVAGQIAASASNDPAMPLTGAELKGLSGLSAKRSNSDLEALITAGVSPVVTENGMISIVRAITTKVADDGIWTEVTTTLIADDIICSVRNSLAAGYRRAKNSEQKRSNIKTDVITILEEKVNKQIIASYTEPTVRQKFGESDKVEVEFGFNVISPMNQILISASLVV